ncbi:MAG: NADP-dependent isocitrate dehydrogenase, partial [Mailhella sp.]|nr:NADP-dependent isocitrate dehydrogenase [Mailhella sp.]
MKHTVYWIEGDGIGPEIWSVARPVIDTAMRISEPGHEIEWIELLAGEKSMKKTGSPLPKETIDALGTASVAIKGPLGTPVGGGMRSLNVTLRQRFDLYACIRPVTWYRGISAPVKHPENVNMVIFRENTEDVYAGIEYEAGSAEAEKLAAFLRSELGADIREHSAIGIKPISEFCSKRLVRKAIRYALEHKLPSVTLVHKGNIMKFTEGGFRKWGYEVARDEFGSLTIPEKEATQENSRRKIIIK